jgi:REP element-mobilizing transposase RayT
LKFDSPAAKVLFLSILSRAKTEYPFRIDNFVMMGNHFHRLFTPTGGDAMATIMKWILGVYTMAFNRVTNTWGKRWGACHFARPIAGFADFVQVFHYIDNNPVPAMPMESCYWSLPSPD